MISCLDVANYFLILVDRNAGDVITQLKLQKLVYFAQGVSLALTDQPLFKEPIEAWEHGPVVRDLRKNFGNLKDGTIPTPGEVDFSVYKQNDKELIYKVYNIYGEHTASFLRNETHRHSIWQEAINSHDKEITQEKIRKFFKIIIDRSLFSVSEADIKAITVAEDDWWMNYDDGEPVQDVTEKVNLILEEYKNNCKNDYKEYKVVQGSL